MVDRLMMHLKPEELMEYFDGTLDDRRVRDHLSTCFQCRSRLKDLFLTRIMLFPPGSEVPEGHVPSEIMAQYVEDTLSIQQNRAVEDHMAYCRRCLADLVSLRTATGMPLNQEPPEAVAASVKKHLDGYRLVTPLGELLISSYEDEVTLDFEPAPEPDEPEVYKEKVAEKLFPFKKSADLKSPIEHMTQKSRLRIAAPMSDAMDVDAVSLSDMAAADIPSEPPRECLLADTALIYLSLDKKDGKHNLLIEVRDLYGIEPLAGVEITVTPVRGEPLTYAADDSGAAAVPVPEGHSTLRIYLEKTYVLDLKPLL